MLHAEHVNVVNRAGGMPKVSFGAWGMQRGFCKKVPLPSLSGAQYYLLPQSGRAAQYSIFLHS